VTIRFAGVGFTYPDGPAAALVDVDVEIDDGELVLVAGQEHVAPGRQRSGAPRQRRTVHRRRGVVRPLDS
jgi:energy-coupling factor transporter ATP-binding protein EcfA2